MLQKYFKSTEYHSLPSKQSFGGEPDKAPSNHKTVKLKRVCGSHSHWDHLGDPSTFPSSTDIIVGPGFSEEHFPGGQPETDSTIKQEYYENRRLREISVGEFNLNIAGFPAFDYFGDGSFYLVNSPGVCPISRFC